MPLGSVIDKMINLGICGTNNSHSVVFSRLANSEELPPEERVEGARCIAFFAYDEENVEDLKKLGLKQVERKEDLIHLVDGVLCVTRDGTKHLEEAIPFLEVGIPTFVDKPLAVSTDDAKSIVDKARETGTPLMSCSALRFAPEITNSQEKLEEISPLHVGTVTGMGKTIFYGVHAAEMMSTVFGSGVEYVFNSQTKGHDMALVHYRDGKTISLQILRDSEVGFRVIAHGEGGRLDMPVESRLYYPETLKQIIRFMETGKTPIPLDHTLEIISCLNALGESADSGSKVYLNSVR